MTDKMRTERIKNHFEEEANEFDGIIQKLIPRYDEMIAVLLSVIPFRSDRRISVIDLGCGTGTVAAAVKSRFPHADITCADIARKMLDTAKSKLGDSAKFIQADFNNFEFPEKFDLAVSSLALHHLENDRDKSDFYKKIYAALTDGGAFINIDVVLGGNGFLQDVYMEKWREFMSASVSEDEINGKWLPNYYAEDRPTRLTAHLAMLKNCGFSCVDVVYKYYNYAVIIGIK
jgi:tRNA (cmo5U34)-methyltransferase